MKANPADFSWAEHGWDNGYAAALTDVENEVERMTEDTNALVTQGEVLAVVRGLRGKP